MDMARKPFMRRVLSGLVTRLRSNRDGNHHLSDREWTVLEASHVDKPRLTGERAQWTEDNLS